MNVIGFFNFKNRSNERNSHEDLVVLRLDFEQVDHPLVY